MKKFAPAFLALLVFILAACNGGDSDSKASAMTVSVSMEVPPGAGIDADDISFSERDPNDYDGSAGAALTGFEFKPDGAQRGGSGKLNSVDKWIPCSDRA